MSSSTSSSDQTDIDHPRHYNEHPSGIECIEVVEAYNFNIGNAIKYLWRAGLKTADPTQDLMKAEWYVRREIERIGSSHYSTDTPADEVRNPGEVPPSIVSLNPDQP